MAKMIGKQVRERKGTRIFTQESNWNVINDTIISRSSMFAPYADNVDDPAAAKLWLTMVKFDGKVIPLRRFTPLEQKITLEDHTVLCAKDTEGKLFLAYNTSGDKARFYAEVNYED